MTITTTETTNEQVEAYEDGPYEFEPGDVCALILRTGERGHCDWLLLPEPGKARRRAYNNVVWTNEGLVRLVRRINDSLIGFVAERDRTLTEADLEPTHQRRAAHRARIQSAYDAIETLKRLQRDPRRDNRPLGWGLQPSLRPEPPEVYEADLRAQAALKAEWRTAAALVQEVLGLTVRDLLGQGYLDWNGPHGV